ncbi:MAG: right-handed parallel beta-helix repeat-containing protein [Kiritimatiellae bacterium]|nr:right-handed parallel beta-helix repeat-containing protein [Kiritimatiellia bacterium]
MRKRFTAAVFCAALAAGAWAVPAAFFVAPGGDDGNAGTLEKPFATLEKARDAVRALKRGGGLPDGGATVWLRGGEYPRTGPLTLTPEDSGEPGKPVAFAAYGDEKPVVSGGRRVTGFRQQAGGVWEASVPGARNGAWVFRTLYVNGSRYTLARSPNRGYYEMTCAVPDAGSPKDGPHAGKSKSAFRVAPGMLRDWPGLSEINLKVWGRWWTALLTVKGIDPAGGVVRVAEPASARFLPYGAKTPFIVENHAGALDAPGEWQLDRTAGVLRVIPRPGDDLGKAEVMAPVAGKLLVLEGDPAGRKFVSHVQFRGIAFQCSNWLLPPEGGNEGSQAAVNIGATVEATGARDCLFEGCELAQTDTYALWLRSGSRRCVVRQCHLHDLGAGGVRLGEATAEPDAVRADGNTVENCFIHSGGHVHGSGIGVWVGASSGNTVTHNEICDLWYTGVSVGWRWSTDLNGTRDNRVTYNRIHHIMQRLEDGGGIYCLGLQPGTVLANNIIHDSGRDGGRPHCRGIYLDEGCASFLVENNLIYDTQDAALRMQLGTGCNTYINNILAFARVYAVDIDVARSCVFMNNIVYLDRGRVFKFDKWPHYEKYISGNLYWRTDGQPFVFAGLPWEEWRKQRQTPYGYFKGKTMDEGSRIADPGFADAAKRDFRLKPGSPALAVGFKPFDLDEIGLTGDVAWRTLPSRARVPIPADGQTAAGPVNMAGPE